MTQLVTIVHLANDQYEHAQRDAYSITYGSTVDPEGMIDLAGPPPEDRVVAHLAWWDYGQENDDAAAVIGYQDLEKIKRLPHDLVEIQHNGTTYWLQSDHGLRFYTLYRAPLED